jgi:mono/diheme cytochrome c family protein
MQKLIFGCLLAICFLLTAWKQKQPSVLKEKMQRGKKVYALVCLTCHMEDGMGVPRMNPALSKSKLVAGKKTKLIRIILRGSEELKDDPTRKYRNQMAAHDHLTDQQIADVLTFVRNSFGNNGSEITPGDVKYVKASVK